MKNNLLNKLKVPEKGEIFEELLKEKNVTIEKIVSSDLIPDKIYNQEQDEWVIILKGSATLEVENETYDLEEYDYLFIKSGEKHRVLRSSKGTIWLAVHIH